jgi:hypothetical protein
MHVDNHAGQMKVAGTLVLAGVLVCAGACGRYAGFTGIEHQNMNLESSQVTWIPHTTLRGPNSVSFTHWQAPSVLDTHQIPTTQNPIPITSNFIHGPSNTIALGQMYRPIGTESAQ